LKFKVRSKIMRRVFSTVTVGIILSVFAAGLLASCSPRQPTLLEIEREYAALERERALKPVVTVVSVAWLILPLLVVGSLSAVGVAFAVVAVRRYANERRPDRFGFVPVPASQLPTVAPLALAAFGEREYAAASRALPPQTLHYKPQFSAAAAPSVQFPAGDEVSAAPALPSVVSLSELAHNVADGVLLGVGAGGRRLVLPPSELFHVAALGSTGGGKSNLTRLLAAQLLATGADVRLVNPHFTAYDMASGEDWRAIARRLRVAPAATSADIRYAFDELADELASRLDGYRTDGRAYPLQLVIVDELPTIAAEQPKAIEVLADVLRQGRKLNLFVAASTQSLLVKAVGGDTTLREALRTAVYFGGDMHSAKSVLDVNHATLKECEPRLGRGVAMVRFGSHAAQLCRVPLADNAAIEALLRHSTATTNGATVQAVGSIIEAPNSAAEAAIVDFPPSAKVALIRRLAADGKSRTAIVREVYGVSGGAKFSAASAEVTAILESEAA
jgi:hypothetical protein